MRRYYGSLCSELYDLTKPVGGDYPDVPYYLRRLAAIGGPVLEAAVGEKWRDGRVVAREVQDFPLRRYEHDEVTALLAETGFVNVEVCGDYAEEAAAVAARDWLCFSAQIPSEAPSSPLHHPATQQQARQ
jgi:hypothetical protein